ncbi:hypothetical protein GY50_0933 [Dehalococcoides mccartyi GY50]|nr:hypothetical protein GY50_0933 [Dehalococcoides mccartyi GY50]
MNKTLRENDKPTMWYTLVTEGKKKLNGDPRGIRTPDLHRDRVAC